jgi:hypothetical protein
MLHSASFGTSGLKIAAPAATPVARSVVTLPPSITTTTMNGESGTTRK